MRSAQLCSENLADSSVRFDVSCRQDRSLASPVRSGPFMSGHVWSSIHHRVRRDSVVKTEWCDGLSETFNACACVRTYLSAPGLARPELLPRSAQLPLQGIGLHFEHVGLDLLSREGAVSLQRCLTSCSKVRANEQYWFNDSAHYDNSLLL